MRHNDILDTLQNLINQEVKQREIAEVLGFPTNTISNRAVRNSDYKLEEILKLNEHFGVNLLTKTLAPNAELIDDQRTVQLDYYPEVFGSCGGGTFALSESTEKMDVPQVLLPAYSSNKKYSVINAYGDSMMPTICDKDMLVVEHNDTDIIDNRVYVFRYGDRIFIKRLVLNINQLLIKSDNSEYDTIKVDLDDNFQLIGRIVGLIRRMG